jgi:hypothetical protein
MMMQSVRLLLIKKMMNDDVAAKCTCDLCLCLLLKDLRRRRTTRLEAAGS